MKHVKIKSKMKEFMTLLNLIDNSEDKISAPLGFKFALAKIRKIIFENTSHIRSKIQYPPEYQDYVLEANQIMEQYKAKKITTEEFNDKKKELNEKYKDVIEKTRKVDEELSKELEKEMTLSLPIIDLSANANADIPQALVNKFVELDLIK